MKNIQVVDDIVGETEKLLSQFYGDDETSFVFTADHGMSKIGNHGDGGMIILRFIPFIDYDRGSQIRIIPALLLSPGAGESVGHFLTHILRPMMNILGPGTWTICSVGMCHKLT